MGWFKIISLIIGLISFFATKKSGTSTAKAALVGAAAGYGTYYVGTETKWGSDLVATLDKSWSNPKEADGTAILNKDGTQASVPPGATVLRDSSGQVLYDENGAPRYVMASTSSSGETLIKTTGQVLSSWGGVGTAAVIGSAGLATGNINWKALAPWLAVGAGLLIISR